MFRKDRLRTHGRSPPPPPPPPPPAPALSRDSRERERREPERNCREMPLVWPAQGSQCLDVDICRAYLELEMKVREEFTITEKAPTRSKGHKRQAGWLA